jgi:tetratricopeptide (TPR) repeat protein
VPSVRVRTLAGDTKRAIDNCLAAESLGPRDPLTILELGYAYRSDKQFKEALAAFTRAIDLVPSPSKNSSSLWYSRASVHDALGDWPMAERDLRKALELDSDQADALNYLGYSLVDRGLNHVEGTRLIERAVALRPDDAYIIDSLGWAYFKRGLFAEAVRHFERAVQIVANDATLLDHLGDAYWRADRASDAKATWQKALEAKPPVNIQAKIKSKIARGL